jgi:hypothetical protein
MYPRIISGRDIYISLPDIIYTQVFFVDNIWKGYISGRIYISLPDIIP